MVCYYNIIKIIQEIDVCYIKCNILYCIIIILQQKLKSYSNMVQKLICRYIN